MTSNPQLPSIQKLACERIRVLGFSCEEFTAAIAGAKLGFSLQEVRDGLTAIAPKRKTGGTPPNLPLSDVSH